MTRPHERHRHGERFRPISTASRRRMTGTGTVLSLALLLAGIVPGCSSPAGRVAVPAPVATPERFEAPPDAVAAGRETRYYVDEKGALWDDRGRKVGTAPKPP